MTTAVLTKVIKVTDALVATSGVKPGNIQNLAAARAKDIAGTADGLVVSRLLDHVPATRAEALAIKARLAAKPVSHDLLVSGDGRTAAIYADFKKDPKAGLFSSDDLKLVGEFTSPGFVLRGGGDFG